MQLRPVRVAFAEVVLHPCGRLGPVADRQHDRRRVMPDLPPLPLCLPPVGAEKRIGVLNQLRQRLMRLGLRPIQILGHRRVAVDVV